MVLRFIAAFDWITPAVGLAQSAMRGELGDTITTGSVADCDGAMTLLRGHGIDIWGHGYDAIGDRWCFKISKRDYHKACSILKRHGWSV